MCYFVYLSTDSSDDLSKENNDLIKFEKKSIDKSLASFLQFKNEWYVGSKDGCSCAFRHLMKENLDLGFCEPNDWFKEDDDQIKATFLFLNIVRNLINKGNQVDCIDVWYDADSEDIVKKIVNLQDIKAGEFRFFENHYFQFMKNKV